MTDLTAGPPPIEAVLDRIATALESIQAHLYGIDQPGPAHQAHGDALEAAVKRYFDMYDRVGVETRITAPLEEPATVEAALAAYNRLAARRSDWVYTKDSQQPSMTRDQHAKIRMLCEKTGRPLPKNALTAVGAALLINELVQAPPVPPASGVTA